MYKIKIKEKNKLDKTIKKKQKSETYIIPFNK